MRKIILSNQQSAGDIVMLTAAVRDLHRCQPGCFSTDVRTPFPELWQNNPWITPLNEEDPDVEVIDCHYPLVLQSNQRPCHFLSGFTEFLSEQLGVHVVPMEFRGDIHLSNDERSTAFLTAKFSRLEKSYWLIVAGGKFDFTIKWWELKRFQAVVDGFRGIIQFVQVGASEDSHPALDGVIDLRGITTLRELISLV